MPKQKHGPESPPKFEVSVRGLPFRIFRLSLAVPSLICGFSVVVRNCGGCPGATVTFNLPRLG